MSKRFHYHNSILFIRINCFKIHTFIIILFYLCAIIGYYKFETKSIMYKISDSFLQFDISQVQIMTLILPHGYPRVRHLPLHNMDTCKLYALKLNVALFLSLRWMAEKILCHCDHR